MLFTGKGTTSQQIVTLTADQQAWIASNPKTYNEFRAEVKKLIDETESERLKLTKAKNLDALVTKAKQQVKEAENTVLSAETEKKAIIDYAKKEAKVIIDKAKAIETASNKVDEKSKAEINTANNAAIQAEMENKAVLESNKKMEKTLDRVKMDVVVLRASLKIKLKILTDACKQAI